MARATLPGTAASSGRCSSTSSTPTATGSASSTGDDFVYGQFGENFTVEGLADDEVCIGDRYQIGGAVFEVTQPRVTCYRVGIRMDDPRIPALLVAHHRPGFYFRVLTEGEVRPDDEIVKLAAGPEALTVAEVDALLYLPGHPRQQLLRALRVPALSPGWQASFQAMLDQGDEGAAGNAGLAATSPPPAWPGFRSLAVSRIDRESDSVVSIHLADPESASVPAALPGQYLTLRLQTEPGAQPLLRNYSLSGRPGADSYRISVKREQHGAASRYLHTRLRVGEQLDVAAPRGTFTLKPGDSPVLLISAGVGATPVLAMLHALAADRSEREIYWLHGSPQRLRPTRSPPSRARSSMPCPTRTGTSASVAPAPTTSQATTTRPRASVGGHSRCARGPRERRCVRLRACRVHARGVRRPGRARPRRPSHPHGALRPSPVPDTRNHRRHHRGRPTNLRDSPEAAL